MNLHQGPAAAASFRRLAGLDRDPARRDEPGGDDNVELLFLRNTQIADGEAVEDVRPAREDDQLPAEEFFQVLANDSSPAIAQVVSPLSDHSLGIRLMGAIYESAISELTAELPRPIRIEFDDPRSWNLPMLHTTPANPL